MPASKPKRNYKDSLFRRYFETPAYLAGFHERVTGIATSAKDIKITTLKNIMFNSQKNDISFLAHNRYMVLTEHQSSVNENMPLRMLLYVAMLYYKQVRRKALYQERRIALPVPEFYELNLSDKKLPLKQAMCLSESFFIRMSPYTAICFTISHLQSLPTEVCYLQSIFIITGI